MSASCGPIPGDVAMRYVATAFAATAFLWLVAPAPAQTYYPAAPGPTDPMYSGTPIYSGGPWPEMMDDGSSSDFPTHTASDFVADQLNARVLQFNEGLRPTPP